MARRRNPARLIIALSVAAVLAVFLLYTSLAGGSTPSLRPSQLADHPGKVSLAGKVSARSRATGARRRRPSRSATSRGARRSQSPIRALCQTSSRSAETSTCGASFKTASSLPSGTRSSRNAPRSTPPSPEAQMPLLGRAALLVALGLVLYATVAGAYAALRGRRRLLESARNAFPSLLRRRGGRRPCLGRRSGAPRLLFRLRRRPHEPRASARLCARGFLGRPGGIAAAVVPRLDRTGFGCARA